LRFSRARERGKKKTHFMGTETIQREEVIHCVLAFQSRNDPMRAKFCNRNLGSVNSAETSERFQKGKEGEHQC